MALDTLIGQHSLLLDWGWTAGRAVAVGRLRHATQKFLEKHQGVAV